MMLLVFVVLAKQFFHHWTNQFYTFEFVVVTVRGLFYTSRHQHQSLDHVPQMKRLF